MAFPGFDRKTLSFLRAVRRNNSKDWLDEHRSEYHERFVEPARAFVAEAGPRIARFAPGVRAEPRIDGSIGRLHRDTRFTADKRPYRDWLDLRFWTGERTTAVGGFFVRIAPEAVTIAAGCLRFDPVRLHAFRAAVADEEAGDALARIAQSLERSGHELERERLERPARGFDASGPAGRFLRFDALFVRREEAASLATGPDLLPACLKHWKRLAPLQRWLLEYVQ